MVTYLIIIAVVAVIMVAVGFALGNKSKGNGQNNTELIDNLHAQLTDLTRKIQAQESTIANQQNQIITLTSERDVQKTHAENFCAQLTLQKTDFEKQMSALKENTQQTINTERDRNVKRESELKETFEKQLADFKASYETQIAELKTSHEKQLEQTKEGAEKQIEALKQMNREQIDSQIKLIKEQMQTTSEEVLKRRQEELGERNKEQVSKIIDPLQQSLKDMQEAFDKSKEQQNEALTRLDETIKINMQKSAQLGETADRLTRALTGEVKVQGNFGELKLKQLLEDLELKEGEQFDTQETLRDKAGKTAKGEDGKGLIPDFILHFPNNRHVVVDSKMSLTDYERYMNAEDGTTEKSDYLKAHIASVRAQVKRLAKKEYTKYLPSGYNRLNFAIMYVPIEGALNLALLNDNSLWREAYDEGVLILGPQTMYMNLRVLEMMWTQVRQLQNQQDMMNAANTVIDRVQDFGIRFMEVESSMNDTIKKISKLKITTADSGPSIITAAKNLIKAGAKENKKKKSLNDMNDSLFIETDATAMLHDESES
ncbi:MULTISPECIES: DNA recombination protein RmuC [unclassified Prevotella]|uniref:DNA recombination protein RmuC n=1 Tax=unclassified Prevotella TaxID=2638335 RepID=UPI000B97B37D|nr:MULTISPECIES: DNA recombination protein RmuC [unclassified Prevotella]OYP40558.1 DNA recombination protein RmuC [Prevotella sp. P5-50]OYP45871.1 DNA recombination protein RmuC [Prevotella sp. P4-98]